MLATGVGARAQPADLPEQYMLILEVRLNGVRSPLLWEFESLPDGALAISAERLRLLGFDLVRLGVPQGQELVRLGDLPGVRFNYRDAAQAIDIDAADFVLAPVVLDADRIPIPIDPALVRQSPGVVLNYDLFADASTDAANLSGHYELRVLGPVGSLTSSGAAYLSSGGPDSFEHIRLDSFWRYVDVRRAIVLAAGDVVGHGGELGAVYRLGGVQVRRDYGNRPDIVTVALPVFSGVAAAPSTVDLYINGTRYFTGETARGPFQFRSLPNLGGGANATVILTDQTGRETRIEQPLYYSPGLLPRGLLDFSFEAGFPRIRYGVESFDYLSSPAASASFRYGLTEGLTVGAHAEGMESFVNGSAGAIVRIGRIGTVRAIFAASAFGEIVDSRYAIDASARLAGIDFFAGIERTEVGYQDIVRMTDRLAALQQGRLEDPVLVAPPGGLLTHPNLLAFSSKTERIGASFGLLDTQFSLGYTRLRLPSNELKVASASVSRSLFDRVSVWANGYKDFGDADSYGVFVGFTVTFRKGVGVSSSFARNERSDTLYTRAWRDPDGSEGSWGWRLSDTEPLRGSAGEGYRSATVRYLARFATLEAGVIQSGGTVRATASAQGSVVAMGGGVFLSPRIEDGFAVVRGAGANIPVLANTRPATRTDRGGRALVPYLSSFRENIVSIDPTDLPVDQRPERTEVSVVPGDRAGTVIDFGVARIAAAVVILVDAGGTPLPVGDVVELEGSAEPAVVGFDGRAYLTGLGARNRIRVQRANGSECSASFDFSPAAGTQAVIGPLTCQ